MSDSTLAVTALDLITGKDSGTGPARVIRLTRSSAGLQMSVDGAVPGLIGGSGLDAVGGIATNLATGTNPTASASIVIDEIKADGTTDDGGALQHWIDSVPANQGAEIKLPAGVIKTKRAILNNGKHGIDFGGKGRRATTILADDSSGNIGDVLTFKNQNGGRIHDLNISAVSGRTAGWGITSQGGDANLPILAGVYAFGANGLHIERVDMANQFGGCRIIDASGPTVGNWLFYLDDCRWESHMGGDGIFLAASSGASHSMNRLFVYNSTGIAASGGAAFHIQASGDFDVTACRSFGTPYGLLIDTGHLQILNAGRFSACFFDSGTTRSGYINVGADRSSFGDVSFENCWFGSSVGDGCLVSGVGVSMLKFVNTTFIHNAGWGLNLNGTTQVDASTCLYAANTLGGFVATQSDHWRVIGGAAQGNTGIFGVLTQPNGVYVNTGCDYYQVVGIDLHDNTTPFTDVAAGAHKIATAGTNFLV